LESIRGRDSINRSPEATDTAPATSGHHIYPCAGRHIAYVGTLLLCVVEIVVVDVVVVVVVAVAVAVAKLGHGVRELRRHVHTRLEGLLRSGALGLHTEWVNAAIVWGKERVVISKGR